MCRKERNLQIIVQIQNALSFILLASTRVLKNLCSKVTDVFVV